MSDEFIVKVNDHDVRIFNLRSLNSGEVEFDFFPREAVKTGDGFTVEYDDALVMVYVTSTEPGFEFGSGKAIARWEK